MDVQRVDEMIDIKDLAADVEELQHQCKERNAAKHHVGEIADQRFDKQLQVRAPFTNLFPGVCLYPFLEWC